MEPFPFGLDWNHNPGGKEIKTGDVPRSPITDVRQIIRYISLSLTHTHTHMHASQTLKHHTVVYHRRGGYLYFINTL